MRAWVNRAAHACARCPSGCQDAGRFPAVLVPDRLDAGALWQFWYPIYALRPQCTCTRQL
eukprot:5406733-Pyramimonas_sp.AAC.1